MKGNLQVCPHELSFPLQRGAPAKASFRFAEFLYWMLLHSIKNKVRVSKE